METDSRAESNASQFGFLNLMQGELDELVDALTLEHQASLLAALAEDR